MNKNQLLDILSKAKNQVRFIGIVALDADWEDLAEKWASKMRKIHPMVPFLFSGIYLSERRSKRSSGAL